MAYLYSYGRRGAEQPYVVMAYLYSSGRRGAERTYVLMAYIVMANGELSKLM